MSPNSTAGSSGMVGSLPTTVGLLTNLVTFEVDYNQLSGTLPTELGQLRSLTRFRVRIRLFPLPTVPAVSVVPPSPTPRSPFPGDLFLMHLGLTPLSAFARPPVLSVSARCRYPGAQYDYILHTHILYTRANLRVSCCRVYPCRWITTRFRGPFPRSWAWPQFHTSKSASMRSPGRCLMQ